MQKEINFRTPKPYSKRTRGSQTKPPIKRFYILCEGEKTEKMYFDGVFNYRAELFIDMLIDIQVLEQKGEHNPHPLNLAKACCAKLEKSQQASCDDADEKAAVEIANDEKVKEFDFSDYRSDLDEIWLVFDRDPGSLTEKQWSEINTLGKEHGINIAISNPTFEIWLLLHVSDITLFSKSELYENKWVTSSKNKRYLEKLLATESKRNYKNKKLEFSYFKDKIDFALTQSDTLETEPPKVFNSLGTSVGLLIKKLRQS